MVDILGSSASRALAWIAALTAVMVVAAGGGAVAAVRFDAAHREVVLQGVTVGGVALGGLDPAEARARLAAAFDAPLDRPITVEADGRQFTATPRELGTRTDAFEKLAHARRIHGAMPLVRRLWLRITGTPVGRELPVGTLVDGAALAARVDAIASEVERPPVDATIELAGGRLRIGDGAPGYSLDRKGTAGRIEEALLSGRPVVHAVGSEVAPSLQRSSVTDVLVVKVGDNVLAHYRGEELVKEYQVATGLPNYPTPLGQFKIVGKRKNPTWVNPAKYRGGWGSSLPARIGPGPRNPLGTRALDLNSPGIRIHGTGSVWSLGYNASHGCIRMRMSEVEELFDLVKAGTPVLIVKTAEFRVAPKTAAPSAPEPTAESDGTAIPGQPGGAAPAPVAEPSPAAPSPAAPSPAAPSPAAPSPAAP